jgi:hypothetical protein
MSYSTPNITYGRGNQPQFRALPAGATKERGPYNGKTVADDNARVLGEQDPSRTYSAYYDNDEAGTAKWVVISKPKS